MEFNKEDFNSNFINRFSNEELKILLDFCRCYYAKFGEYVSKDKIIKQMEELDSFTHINDENASALATHFVVSTDNRTKIQKMYIEINDAVWDKSNLDEKKAVIYHELMHHFSTKEIKGQKIQRGLTPIDYKERVYLDEIMTEYYATELLRIDHIDMTKYYTTYKSNNLKIDRSAEYIYSKGKGYVYIAEIGQVYDSIFRKRLFDGKTENYNEFKKIFNERFKQIGENPLLTIQEQLKKAIKTSSKDAIYKCYQTALQIFSIDRNNHYEKQGFDLYDYLARSNSVVRSLPIKDIDQFTMDKTKGIPEELFETILKIDREMIVKYIRPDILKIKDEDEKNREINKLSSVINILRENIGSLSRGDLEQITYGKIEEYTHNGLDCLVIKAGDKSFQTFVHNTIELNRQFMPYCSFKTPEKYDSIFNTNTEDQQIRNLFEQAKVPLGDNYTISTIMNVGGEYPMYGLIENDGKYYKTSGKLEEVQISDKRTFAVNSKEKVAQQPQTKELQTKSNKSISNKKMAWIKGFIDDYKASSINVDGLRFNEENDNILRVLDSIKTGSFNIIQDLSANESGQQNNAIGKLARLLIAADNITIDGGENFLEQFSNLPEVTKLLLQFKNSHSVKEMQERANKARESGDYPKYYRETRAETDKRLAQEYLKSNNLSKNSIEEEIEYRKGLTRNKKIKISNEKDKDKISLARKQQISLTRILARQLGKIPSEAKYDEKIGWYCLTDEQDKVQSSVSGEEVVASHLIFSPQRITDSTIKVGITRHEVSGVIKEIRKTQTRDLQQIDQK